MGGHYVAFKRLFPQENDSKGSWIIADDDEINILTKG